MPLNAPTNQINVEITLNDAQVREALTNYCHAGGFLVQSLTINVVDGKASAHGSGVRVELSSDAYEPPNNLRGVLGSNPRSIRGG